MSGCVCTHVQYKVGALVKDKRKLKRVEGGKEDLLMDLLDELYSQDSQQPVSEDN